jgi:hypothetical protein
VNSLLVELIIETERQRGRQRERKKRKKKKILKMVAASP